MWGVREREQRIERSAELMESLDGIIHETPTAKIHEYKELRDLLLLVSAETPMLPSERLADNSTDELVKFKRNALHAWGGV